VTQHDDFARRLTASLNQGLMEIDALTSQRLASMRGQTLAGDNMIPADHSVLAWASRPAWIAGFLALALLLAGWWFMQPAPSPYSAETDILLLTGELPPAAYADNTFSQWLEKHSTF